MNEATTLVADSGSTKTEWRIGGHTTFTDGINPVHLDDEAIRNVLCNELLPGLGGREASVEHIRFYGSGVRADQEERMRRLLAAAFPGVRTVEAASDLLAAARALLGTGEGIACILGTGANSGLYDGRQITQSTPALGYVLGDEGSGAVLGRRLLNALYKGVLPYVYRQDFEDETGLCLNDVIERTYRQPMPSRWLASLSPFIHSHIDEPWIRKIVVDNFRDFLRLNIARYQRADLPVCAVGSIAFHYREQLEEAARAEGFTIGTVLRSPMERFDNLILEPLTPYKQMITKNDLCG